MFADWSSWITVVCAGIVTLLARSSFIVLPQGTSVPEWLQRGLKFVAAAVLPALVIPAVLFREVAPGEMFNYYRVAAALFALLVAWKTRNLFATLGAGMVALWVLQWVMR
jgi:branched-subunit amino acid transport protein